MLDRYTLFRIMLSADTLQAAASRPIHCVPRRR